MSFNRSFDMSFETRKLKIIISHINSYLNFVHSCFFKNHLMLIQSSNQHRSETFHMILNSQIQINCMSNELFCIMIIKFSY